MGQIIALSDLRGFWPPGDGRSDRKEQFILIYVIAPAGEVWQTGTPRTATLARFDRLARHRRRHDPSWPRSRRMHVLDKHRRIRGNDAARTRAPAAEQEQ